MSNFKVEILLDEEKIIRDDKYEPQAVYNCIRDSFAQFNLPEQKTEKPYHLIFTDKDRKTDYGALWRVILDLYEMDWFKRYIRKYTWYNGKDTPEDILNDLQDSQKQNDSSSDKCYKAINFDLNTNALKEILQTKNPIVVLKEYKKIGKFLESKGFTHRQGLGYVSNEKMSETKIVIITNELNNTFPWFCECVRRFDVTDVGKKVTIDISKINLEESENNFNKE